ncbi:MAG: hypothetical protein ABI365_01660 [Lysobacteraceae bacterium]
MNRKLLDHAPIGRIYDPLLQLAQRVHRAMAGTNKIVWTDSTGRIFATSIEAIERFAPHAVVGTFDKTTPRSEIESALRLALRERASSWIVDWKAQPQRLARVKVGRRLPSCRHRLGPTDKDRAAVTIPPHSLPVDGNPSMA